MLISLIGSQKLREVAHQNFSGRACPQTSLGIDTLLAGDVARFWPNLKLFTSSWPKHAKIRGNTAGDPKI